MRSGASRDECGGWGYLMKGSTRHGARRDDARAALDEEHTTRAHAIHSHDLYITGVNPASALNMSGQRRRELHTARGDARAMQ
jgi:hypothetical protein